MRSLANARLAAHSNQVRMTQTVRREAAIHNARLQVSGRHASREKLCRL
jgi:hypothetical protein